MGDVGAGGSIHDQLRLVVQELSGPKGAVAGFAFFLAALLSLRFDRTKWIWLTLAVYVLSLGLPRGNIAGNTLAAPLQQLRGSNRLIAYGLLCVMLIPTVRARRGNRSRIVGVCTLAFFAFEILFALRYVSAGFHARGVLGLRTFSLIFLTVGVGLSHWLQDVDDVLRLLRSLLSVGGLVVVGTLYQLAVNRSVVVSGGRLSGTTANPQHLAFLLGILMPVAAHLLARREEPRFWRAAAASFVGIGAVMLVATGSRTGALTAVFGVALLFRTRLGLLAWVVALACLAGLVALPLLGDAAVGAGHLLSTENTRREAIRFLWSRFMDNPWFGSGDEAMAENSYLSALACFGIVGTMPLVLCLAFILTDFARIRRLRKYGMVDPLLANLAVACVASFLLASFFEAFLLGTITDPLLLFYCFLAFLTAVADPAGPAAMLPTGEVPAGEAEEAVAWEEVGAQAIDGFGPQY